MAGVTATLAAAGGQIAGLVTTSLSFTRDAVLGADQAVAVAVMSLVQLGAAVPVRVGVNAPIFVEEFGHVAMSGAPSVGHRCDLAGTPDRVRSGGCLASLQTGRLASVVTASGISEARPLRAPQIVACTLSGASELGRWQVESTRSAVGTTPVVGWSIAATSLLRGALTGLDQRRSALLAGHEIVGVDHFSDGLRWLDDTPGTAVAQRLVGADDPVPTDRFAGPRTSQLVGTFTEVFDVDEGGRDGTLAAAAVLVAVSAAAAFGWN